MEDKKQRDKILEGFTKIQLEALRDLFSEKIAHLTDIEQINSFEEMLGRKIAIQVLKRIMIDLKLLKEPKFEKKKSEYE